MKIALFGATGHTGRYILDEALDGGHDVTILVRDASRVHRQGDRLHRITGDALHYSDVKQAVSGQDAVLFCISEGPDVQLKTKSRAATLVTQAMRECGVSRIIAMGAIGILQKNGHELLRDQPGYPALYLPLSYEHSEVNRILQQSGLDWTQVCPPNILPAPADGRFLVNDDYPASTHMEVSAGNIGRFMIRELAEGNHLGKRVGISNFADS